MVCSISQGTSLTPPFNLVFFPQRQAAWVPRHAISATKGLAWGPHDTATTLEKTKKTMGSVRFGWGQYPKKLRESESGKKKMELTDFLIGILPNFMFRGVNGFRFSLTSGEGFFRSVPSLSLTFRPPKLTVMKKSLLVLSRSGLKTQGPYSWQVSGRDWYQLTCKKWDPLKWPQQVSLRPEDLGFMTTRGALTPHVLSLGHL